MTTQLTNELPVSKALEQAPQMEQPSYKVGDIIIPGDIKLFNQMWRNKEFDKIDPADFDQDQFPIMYRGDNGFHTWADTFFTRRRDLTYRTAIEIWESSIYHSTLSIEVQKILNTNNPLEAPNYDYVFSQELFTNYLSAAPETLMFPQKNKRIIYTNSKLLPIYRDLIDQFQLLGNKTNNKRTSIYLNKLHCISNKIQFIQTLSYYGLDATICRFKKFKNNYLDYDPEITAIMIEPVSHLGVWKTTFRKALYDFYSLCVSVEKITADNDKKMRLIGATIIHHEDIRLLLTSYLLSMKSCIKQDKLHTICGQLVLSYLRPECITEDYIITILSTV
jgi:hypothetical protein